MMKFLLQFFTWWNGQTLGTRFFTWRKGEFVGEDLSGNLYYRQRGGSRRWVIYAGVAEPSMVPPDWHGWLHQTVDTPPTEEAYEPRPWQKPHRANMTGTPAAYRPKGSILSDAKRPAATGDYEAWQPE
jgi:NADH:ubiquinone oxidoreductase subunit